jgi:hypothetical protein
MLKPIDTAAVAAVSAEDPNAGIQHTAAAHQAKTAVNHAKYLQATYHAISKATKGNVSSQHLGNSHAGFSHAYHLVMRDTKGNSPKLMHAIKGNSSRCSTASLHVSYSPRVLEYSHDPHTFKLQHA